MKRKSGGEDSLRSTYVLRKHRSPVAVYDVSTRRRNNFFALLGKITFFCVISSSVFITIVWMLHRPHLTSTDTSTNAAGTSSTAPEIRPATAHGPEIKDVAFWGITGSGITISWSTDQLSTTAVAYGTTSALGQITPVQPKLSHDHGTVLTGLNGGTKYNFAAQSVDANGNVGRSTVYTFTTAVTSPPTISRIVVTPGGHNEAKISWTTSVSASSYIQYGLTTAYDKWSKKTEFTTHPQPEMGWVPSGPIHYQLVSTDSHGNQAISPDYTFIEP